MLSYLEISERDMLHNLEAMRSVLPPDTLVSVAVKGNAYGHGLGEVVACLKGKVDYFQVDDLEELRRIRAFTDGKVLVLGYVARDEWPEALRLGASFAMFSKEEALAAERSAAEIGIVVPVHLMIDTGLGREGVLPHECEDFVRFCSESKHLQIEGLYSHFANVEDTEDPTHAKLQLERFNEAKKLLPSGVLTHVSGTGGAMLYEDKERNGLVRLGIGVYGMWPSESLQRDFMVQGLSLRPVLRWITHIAQLKSLPAGHPIGYGLSYVTEKPMTVALVPQGYSDGYDRALSNKGEVLVHGKRRRVLGRVSMNMFVVDVSDSADTVNVEDEVVLLGAQGTECIYAEEVAEKCGTINYEVTTRISPLLPRILK